MISIVLPVYNEQENIRAVYDRLTVEMDRLGDPYELIFVDDGSSDGSLRELKELCHLDPCVRAISLSRNFGHQIAISAGLEHASGQAVIVMDADLQHPPEIVPELVARWKAGFDVVCTVRAGSEHAGPFKRVSAAAFYRILNRICDIKITPNTPDFRLMDRQVVDTLLRMPERARFLRGLVSWVGFKQTAVEFVANPRLHGSTKFPMSKMIRFSLDGVTAFSSVPLRLSSYVGFLTALAGLPYAIWAIYSRLFTNNAAQGWASVIVAVLFLGAVQLIAIGILGEYLGRIYEEVKGRPLYVAREIFGTAPRAGELTGAGVSSPERHDAGAHGSVQLPPPATPRRRPARILSR